MKIYFFKSLDGSYQYTSRKRYTECPTSTVIDRYMLLGSQTYNNIPVNNGAFSFLKVDNAFKNTDYIVMYDVGNDNTETLNSRWFVIQSVYLNGKQHRLDLQRDVIGEKTVSDMYGKIERGVIENNNILINKKELELNEILKFRKHLIPKENSVESGIPTYNFGSYTVKADSDLDIGKDLWGILYFSKQNSENIKIDIPSFSKLDFNLPYKGDNYSEVLFVDSNYDFNVRIRVPYNSPNNLVTVNIGFRVYQNADNYVAEFTHSGTIQDNNAPTISFGDGSYLDDTSFSSFGQFVVERAFSNYLNYCNGTYDLGVDAILVKLPPKQNIVLNSTLNNYNDKIIKTEDKYYKCSVEETIFTVYGYYDRAQTVTEYNIRRGLFRLFYTSLNNVVYNGKTIIATDSYSSSWYYYNYQMRYNQKSLVYEGISYSDANAIELTTEGDVIDEPFFVVAMPLYNCRIKQTEPAGSPYTQYSKNDLFFAYNSIIKGLSGDNGLLVDAQIIPYCPNLKSKIDLKHYNADVNDFTVPLFYLQSSSYERVSEVGFNISDISGLSYGIGYVDINKKKEYTKRHYNIVSPDQSGRYLFNFYDYVNKTFTLTGSETYKTQSLQFTIKIALKPFSIIASCIIQRVDGQHTSSQNLPLKGITYPSDLRGSQPNSGGFQASLASNAFQTYLRSNSNYQQIFNKQQERLSKEQGVERETEKIQATLNSISAGAMGAIAGASMTGGGLAGIAGAVGGAAVAAGGTAIAYQHQISVNEGLREYEYNYNQEMFDLNIGTIKNIPDSVNRISTFNEIILKDFWFTLELYECTKEESDLVDMFFDKYGYDIGVYGLFSQFKGSYLKGNLLTSKLQTQLHNIAQKELQGGVYYIDD